MQTVHTLYAYMADSLCKKLEFTIAMQCAFSHFGDYQFTLICAVPRGVERHPCLRCFCNIIDKICTNQDISWAISWVLLTDSLK